MWPIGDKLKDSFPATIDKIRLDSAMDDFFFEPDSKHMKYTRAVLIVYDGQIIAERYRPGYSKDQKLLGWSMSKSVTGALIGILANKGLINIDSTPPIQGWEGQNARHSIKTKYLLQQVSGLKFEENYTKVSDATKMLYEKADMAAYAASNPLDTIPGTRFSYSSGNSNILSRVVRNITGEDKYHAFPYTELFYKLGMHHTIWEPDESGTYVGSSYVYASARDWARFGLFYLNNGFCQQERLLPEGWVTQSGTPGPAQNFDHYGFQFWLNIGKHGSENKVFPHVPDPMFYADGYDGQDVYIIPSKRLVIVRLGMTAGGDYHADRSLGLVLSSFR